MAVIYCPTRSEERIIIRIHNKLRKRFREIRDNPRIRKKDEKLHCLRMLNREACSKGPDRFKELVGEARYDRLLQRRQQRGR